MPLSVAFHPAKLEEKPPPDGRGGAPAGLPHARRATENVPPVPHRVEPSPWLTTSTSTRARASCRSTSRAAPRHVRAREIQEDCEGGVPSVRSSKALPANTVNHQPGCSAPRGYDSRTALGDHATVTALPRAHGSYRNSTRAATAAEPIGRRHSRPARPAHCGCGTGYTPARSPLNRARMAARLAAIRPSGRRRKTLARPACSFLETLGERDWQTPVAASLRDTAPGVSGPTDGGG